jgi:hypothetical protein
LVLPSSSESPACSCWWHPYHLFCQGIMWPQLSSRFRTSADYDGCCSKTIHRLCQ